jgi:hypothetical protein
MQLSIFCVTPLCCAETNTPCWEGEIRVPYSAFAFTYKYAVITRSRAAAMAASAANGSSAAAAAPPDAAATGSPRAADALNGQPLLDARLAGLSLAGATPNGPLATGSSAVEGTAVGSLPAAVAAVPSAALDASTSAATAAAAAAAAIAGQPSYVAAYPLQPQGQAADTGAGISAIFRNATSTLLEVGEPRVCRCDHFESCRSAVARTCCTHWLPCCMHHVLGHPVFAAATVFVGF